MRSNLQNLMTPVLGTSLPTHTLDSEIEILKEIPVESLFLALKECDQETKLWLYEYALPEQVQGILDLSCWEGSSFVSEHFEDTFIDLTTVSPPKLLEYLNGLDPEIWVRGFLSFLKVEDFDPQNPPDTMDSQNSLLTPDNKYLLSFTEPEKISTDLREAIVQFLNKASSVDLEKLRRLLESCKWEIPSDLEEHAYQVKKGRIEELGFVDYHEAIKIYSAGSASTYKKTLEASPLPEGTKTSTPLFKSDHEEGLTLEFLPTPLYKHSSSDFLDQALSHIESSELRSLIIMEIIRTVNSALAADKLMHKSYGEISSAALRTRKYIELGLIYLSNGDLAAAERNLINYPLESVFHLGWLAVQDLVSASKEIKKTFGKQIFGRKDATLLDELESRHPTLSYESQKELGIASKDNSSHLSFKSILIVGERVKQISQLGRFFMKELSQSLGFPEVSLLESESAYTRLTNGIFRQSSGLTQNTFSGLPLKIAEWKEARKNLKPEAMSKFAKAISSRCPKESEIHFSNRLQENISDLEFYLNSNSKDDVPDTKFFKALSFSL